jgi:hypothetical protein
MAEAVETMRAATGATVPQVPGGTREPELDIPAGTSAQEAAAVLAAALRRVPGIGRYRDARLDELAARGPRIARTLWERARPRIAEGDRSMTIGQLLDRFAS